MSSPAPRIDHPQLSVLFPRQDENIVIIPMWEKCPVACASRSTGKSLLLEDPVFTKTGSLSYVHEKIPSKTSAGIVSPDAAIGRLVTFYGFVIASETGRYLLLDKSTDYSNTTAHGEFTNDDKNALIAFMATGKRAMLDDMEAWDSFFIYKDVHTRFSNADRDRIVSFLEEIGKHLEQ
jgi:hypothetical protein